MPKQDGHQNVVTLSNTCEFYSFKCHVNQKLHIIALLSIYNKWEISRKSHKENCPNPVNMSLHKEASYLLINNDNVIIRNVSINSSYFFSLKT